ncbi:MAG: flavodoxin [Clostridiales bacterium]|nr:flavodoxin [Clostridiales bacterium]
MKKIAVVYFSMTGNTEAMAGEVVTGAKEAGADVSLFSSADFKADMLDQYDGIAFGCPAMGNEELEEGEFEPLFADCERALGQKPIVLFGSYSWADGQWMLNWKDRCDERNLNVLDTVIAYAAPDAAAIEACRKLGKTLAEA